MASVDPQGYYSTQSCLVPFCYMSKGNNFQVVFSQFTFFCLVILIGSSGN